MLKEDARRPLLLVTVALLTLGLLVFAACGPTDEPEPDPVTVAIDLGDWYFVERGEEPPAGDEEVPTITVQADGANIIFDLANVSNVEAHDFTIDALGIQYVLAEGEAVVSAEPHEIAPGEYAVFCSVPGHAALGMVSTLVVE